MAQEQRVMRRVYTDSGELIREGLVDKNIKNERQSLLDWWAAEDAQTAEAEALAAQSELDRISSLEQAPQNEAMAIPGLVAAVDQHATLIEELNQRTAGLESAVPEETLRLASQIALAAGSAVAVEATARQVQEQIRTVGAEAQTRLDELDQRTAASVGQIVDLIVGSRQQLDLTSSQIVADTKRQVAALVTSTTARVEALRGPRGDKGAAGASTVIGAGVPQGPDAMMPLIGRGAVMGDCYIDGSDDARRAYRYDGKSWDLNGPAMVSLQVRDVKISAMDASTKVTSLQVASGGGNSGLGGGGGESLLSRTVPSGGSAMLSESARWAIPLAAAGLPAPDACTITLELTAADGSSSAGKKLFVTCKALYEPLAPSTSSLTIYSELGELVGQVDVDFTIQSAPAVLPPGLPAVTIPPGVLSYQVFARITSNTSGATQFLLAGAVSWMQPNAVIPGSATTPPQIVPAWSLV